MFTTAKRHHFIAHTRTVTMSFKPNGAVKLSKCRYFQLLSISVLHCFEISLLIFWFNLNFGCNAIFKKMFHCTILSLNFFLGWSLQIRFSNQIFWMDEQNRMGHQIVSEFFSLSQKSWRVWFWFPKLCTFNNSRIAIRRWWESSNEIYYISIAVTLTYNDIHIYHWLSGTVHQYTATHMLQPVEWQKNNNTEPSVERKNAVRIDTNVPDVLFDTCTLLDSEIAWYF